MVGLAGAGAAHQGKEQVVKLVGIALCSNVCEVLLVINIICVLITQEGSLKM